MDSLSECPVGTDVVWSPSNKSGQEYRGRVVAHNSRGEDIYGIPGFEERRAGKPGATASFHRVVVKADHDGKWHAQGLKGLRVRRGGSGHARSRP